MSSSDGGSGSGGSKIFTQSKSKLEIEESRSSHLSSPAGKSATQVEVKIRGNRELTTAQFGAADF